MRTQTEVIEILEEKKNLFMEMIGLNPIGIVDTIRVENVWISGGCIASLFIEHEPKDYDFYCTDEETLNFCLQKLNENNHIHYRNQDAIILSNKFELITRRVGLPAVIIDRFDFLHCQGYFVNKQYYNLGIVERCAEGMITMYVNNETPIRSMHRMIKFASRGWKIPKRSFNSCINDIRNLDLSTEKAKSLHLVKSNTGSM